MTKEEEIKETGRCGCSTN